ncbi:mitochondrial outer membrane protein porin of 36 kDa-like isoform X3 [Camellia sinensis]|uniref:mitochondrial outer membrane protein porin of 36 kDa-like isoform X3 n=1 Tax=Camellia sinensis TaxID=4442 RepID=UPI001036C831|nr:mitochondrial outer membrane protein porin of 36 kDa-like isoform X3 [Camellia sinensis]
MTSAKKLEIFSTRVMLNNHQFIITTDTLIGVLICRVEVELQYLHDYVGISAGAGLTTTPLLNFSGVLGSGFFSIGTDISFDVGARQFAKYNAGLSFNTAILITSLTLNDKGDTLRASCHHTISPLTDTAIAAELTHKFLRNETTLTFGTQHAFFPITLVKARASSNGRLGALVQQELFPSFLLTVAGDVDVWDVMRSAKLGLSLAFRP